GVRGDRDLPSHRVSPDHFPTDAVPRIAAFRRVAAGEPYHDRRGPPVVGPPPHRAAVVELLGRRVGVLAELNLGDREQTGERHPDRPPDDALFGEARVEYPLVAERV